MSVWDSLDKLPDSLYAGEVKLQDLLATQGLDKPNYMILTEEFIKALEDEQGKQTATNRPKEVR